MPFVLFVFGLSRASTVLHLVMICPCNLAFPPYQMTAHGSLPSCATGTRTDSAWRSLRCCSRARSRHFHAGIRSWRPQACGSRLSWRTSRRQGCLQTLGYGILGTGSSGCCVPGSGKASRSPKVGLDVKNIRQRSDPDPGGCIAEEANASLNTWRTSRRRRGCRTTCTPPPCRRCSGLSPPSCEPWVSFAYGCIVVIHAE